MFEQVEARIIMISIHALEGCLEIAEQFLSTPSSRRATYSLIFALLSDCISIHALLAEGDSKVAQKRATLNVQEG